MPTERSTKRQQELLTFIDGFIKEHGYGPSYREVMNALGYKSVSTVAVHVDGLISKGYLQKRENSARSLEVISSVYGAAPVLAGSTGRASSSGKAHEKWLVTAITERLDTYKSKPSPQLMDELYVLIGSLKVLGFDEAYVAMRARLSQVI